MIQASKLLGWSGQTAVILASGPSLTPDQILAVEEADVMSIAVNNTAYSMAIPDVIYAGDFMWWKVNHKRVDVGRASRPSHWTCDRSAAERFGLNWIKGVNQQGLGHGPWLHTNGNSGAQAINLAYLFGARRILLLGFDMKLGPNGEKHHHPDHPAPMVQSQTFGDWIHKFNLLAVDLRSMGCEVINCTPGSALHCFPHLTLEEALA